MLLHFYLLSAAGVVGLGPVLSFLFSLSSVLDPWPSCFNLPNQHEKYHFGEEEIFLGN